MVSMYCVKCKAKKEVAEGSLKKVPTKRATVVRLVGKCPDCGTTVNKFAKA